MNVNLSIPVNLFDFRESANPLYSYAKLKIFYIGMTGDNRLFTKKFSNSLLETIAYVPVVGFYDEEEEDFKGHHAEIQNIYGIVPEDTVLDYIEEDGKEYAVCDVILYTGREDKTGKIAQKIVGKSHSLELDPKTIEYKVNKDSFGKVKNIEFLSGSLLGLSILGDNERPAFSGSEFFTEKTHFAELIEDLKREMKEFTKQKEKRGEGMDLVTSNEQDILNVDITVEGTDLPAVFATVEGAEGDVLVQSTVADPENTEDEVAVAVEATGEEKFMENFMRVTMQEMQEGILKSFYEAFGSNVYVVQISATDNSIVFMNFEDYQYKRVNFTGNEEDDKLVFGEVEAVKMRFLTDMEIEAVWPETQENFGEGKSNVDGGEITPQENIDNSSIIEEGGEDNENFQEQEQENADEGEQEPSSTALDSGEREELEKSVNDYSIGDLEIILSKEFTKISRQEKKITKTNSFIYTNNGVRPAKTESEIVADLVDRYKTRK